MPVVRRRNRHDIDRFVFKHLANVAIVSRLLLGLLFHRRDPHFADRLIDVDDGGNLAILTAAETSQMILTAPANTHARDAQLFVRALRLLRRLIGANLGRGSGHRGCGRGKQRLLEKITSGLLRHGELLPWRIGRLANGNSDELGIDGCGRSRWETYGSPAENGADRSTCQKAESAF